ncbi:hypothetical protein MRS44_010561 [Fusarium solani]|uniref:Uncharacterized protein n=1 Tax=Fusarium solani TaxID=169388 RepID=A0A9P9H078_FUSSL|nr:uncharacterized protein B0J15DRAFT_551632 [Fusarium solani]KAH7247973.1 hypothetical protein B0J15DRAFT_551632 [Fusarium solani]KAJ3462008.1 hypothetical protein MRS44_010561 [Fusarium solani]
MTFNSASTDTGHVNGGVPSTDHSSMLLPFLYDTSSFSDRQVQIANGGATSSSTYEPAPSHPNADASDHNKNKKENDKPVDK